MKTPSLLFWLALILTGSWVVSDYAGAVVRFKCGTYAIQGRLYVDAHTRGAIPRKPIPDKLDLVIFEGTLSELTIPVQVAPQLKEWLDHQESQPIPGSFEVDILEEGRTPTKGILRARRLDPSIAESRSTDVVKFLTAKDCAK